MTQITQVNITQAHVRAAMQSAVGAGLKAPSLEFEAHVAKYLTNCKFWTIESEPEPENADGRKAVS